MQEEVKMENKIHILLADEDNETRKSTKELLSNNYLVDEATTGNEVKNKLIDNDYDAIIMDVMLSEIDGFALLEFIKRQNIQSKIIIVSNIYSNTFIQKAMNMGASYYMIKPVSARDLLARVEDVLAPNLPKFGGQNIVSQSSVKSKQIEEKITNIFITVGIPAHIKGYQFLREAIKMAIENPEIINSITKKLYPSIADRFSTSSSKVERAIRHAIEVAWNRGKIENINSVFGLKVYSSNEKPTNGEFIALVADKMLMEG